MAESNHPAANLAAAIPQDDEVDLLDLLQVVADNVRLLIIVPLAAGLVALGISFLITPTFTATTKFMPPLQQQSNAALMVQSLGALGGLAGVAGIKNPNDQIVAFLNSESVTNILIEQFELITRYEVIFKADARKQLAIRSQITSGKDGLISIEFDDHDPVFAAKVANAYVDELRILLKRLAITEAQQRRAFFETQLSQTKDKFTIAEQALRASGVNSTALKFNPETAIRTLAELQARIAAQEIKLASMRGYLAEAAPDFKQAQTELTALRIQLNKFESTAAQSSTANADADYVARLRDVKYYETLFDLFSKQFELAKADEAREGAVVQVVDVALPPERKSRPKRALVAVLTSLSVGVLLLISIFVRQTLRKAAESPETAGKMAHLRSALARSIRRA
jgi:tyrosine-protein kinase Etk/Wzc